MTLEHVITLNGVVWNIEAQDNRAMTLRSQRGCIDAVYYIESGMLVWRNFVTGQMNSKRCI